MIVRIATFIVRTYKPAKAAPRFELGVKVLQTLALPLGYAARI